MGRWVGLRQGGRGAGGGVGAAAGVARGGGEAILSGTPGSRIKNPDPNPERSRHADGRGGRERAMRRASARSADREGGARSRRASRAATRGVASALAVAGPRRRARAPGRDGAGKDSRSAERRATYRHDGEAGVRDTRRGRGRANLGTGEGTRQGKPRHVEKARHLCLVLRERVGCGRRCARRHGIPPQDKGARKSARRFPPPADEAHGRGKRKEGVSLGQRGRSRIAFIDERFTGFIDAR